jgi:hypothetical protein
MSTPSGWSRLRSPSFLLVLAGALGAGPAAASPIGFTGTLSLQVIRLPPLVVPGSGIAQVSPGPHIGSIALPSGAFATTNLTIVVTDPGVFPISGLGITVENGAGTLSGAGGTLPLVGAARFCLFAPCLAPVGVIPVPLGAVGVGGASTAPGVVNVTVLGGPWTTGMITVGATFFQTVATGFRHGPVSGTSSTAAQGGALRLVTPILISTSIASDVPFVPAFAALDLHFVPEPATALLLACGLAVMGRSALARRPRR